MVDADNLRDKDSHVSALQKIVTFKNLTLGRGSEIASPAKEKRLIKLGTILEALKNNSIYIHNNRLKRWLTKDEFNDYKSQWKFQLELRVQRIDKPNVLVEYEGLLRKAMFFENRINGYKGSNTQAAQSMREESELYYEKAAEYLEQAILVDPMLNNWLDRAVDFSAKGKLSYTTGGMPLVVTSRSSNKQSVGFFMGKMNKREVKIDVVERAIKALNDSVNALELAKEIQIQSKGSGPRLINRLRLVQNVLSISWKNF